MAEPYNALLDRKKVLGGAEESTAGTAETIASGLSGTVIYDARMEPFAFFDNGERRPIADAGGTYDYVAGKTLGRLTFRQELRNADVFVDMLTGAGFVLNTGTYYPTSSMGSIKTWTFNLWEDGRLKQIYGAAGNCQIEIAPGNRVFASWTWEGLWTAPTDASVPSQAAINTAPYIGESLTYTIGAAAAPHTSGLTIDLGNTIVQREDLTASSGVKHFHPDLMARAPRVTARTEARTVAQDDAFGKMLSGTTAALSIALGGSGNTLTFAVPRGQIIDIRQEEAGGKLLEVREYACNHSSGDDELTVTEATA